MKEKHRLEIEQMNGMLCLHLNSPIALSRFAAFLRQTVKAENSSAFLLCRGQTNHSPEIKPSLFRVQNDAYHVDQLLKAEEKVIGKVQKSGLKRFMRSNLPALLQHYGVRTSWLDVVDNLFVSVWFATHYFDKIKKVYLPSSLHSEG